MVHSYDVGLYSGSQHISLAVVYRAHNFLNDDVVAIKLELVTHNPSSMEHEHPILKKLEGGVGIPRTLWFDRESKYHALALDLLGPSLHDLFLACDQKFSIHTVVNLGEQLVLWFKFVVDHCKY